MGTQRVRNLALLAIVAITALSGCIKTDLKVYVADDNTADVTMDAAISKQLLEFMGAFAEPGDEEIGCDTLMEESDLPSEDSDVTVETSEDEDWCRVSMTGRFDSIDEMNSDLNESDAESETEADADAASSDIQITESDGSYRFEVGDLGLTPDPDDPFSEMTESFSEDVELDFAIRLPGRPVDHNADRVEGNTFSWHLEWGDERDVIFAETEPGEPDNGSTSRDDFAALADDDVSTASSPTETTAPAATTVSTATTVAATQPVGTEPLTTEAAATATTIDGVSAEDAATTVAAIADDTSDSGSSALWILLIVVALLALGGIVFLFMRSRGGSGTPPPTTPTPPTPPSDLPPPPPSAP